MRNLSKLPNDRSVPSAVLPEQLRDRLRAAPSPERLLYAAVLESALHDYCIGGALRHAVVQWLYGAWAPLPFVAVCEFLNVDADWLRVGIIAERWRGKHFQEAP